MTDFERRILEAIRDLGENAYGVPLAHRLGCTYGALYATLERLEDAGRVTHWTEPGGPERGGRVKRYWKVKE